MSLFFSKLVKTAFNVAALPLAVGTDVLTLGGVCTGQDTPYTHQAIEQIKEDAD